MAQVELFARTEVGCARERNEDTFLVLNLVTGERGLKPHARVQSLQSPGTCVAVFDGMGGAAAGDIAAQLAADELDRTMRQVEVIRDASDGHNALLRAVVASNRAIAAHARENPEKKGMGTTMTAAVAFGPEVAIVQVGDSRAYLRRGRALQPLTVDQNVVGQMVAAGQLSPQDARNYDQRNVLLQALGVQERVSPDVVRVTVRAGDVLLLCTDGLTGPLPDDAVLDIMVRHEDPLRCCRALTEAACAAGGPDNVTVAVARFTGEDLALPQGREPIQFERSSTTV